MKLLADECCAASLVEALRKKGHDVLYVPESLRGASDDVVLQRAFVEGRILVTEDKDFGELVYRLRAPARGIILLRFAVNERDYKADRLCHVLAEQADRLSGSFVVIEQARTRVRPLV